MFQFSFIEKFLRSISRPVPRVKTLVSVVTISSINIECKVARIVSLAVFPPIRDSWIGVIKVRRGNLWISFPVEPVSSRCTGDQLSCPKRIVRPRVREANLITLFRYSVTTRAFLPYPFVILKQRKALFDPIRAHYLRKNIINFIIVVNPMILDTDWERWIERD